MRCKHNWVDIKVDNVAPETQMSECTICHRLAHRLKRSWERV